MGKRPKKLKAGRKMVGWWFTIMSLFMGELFVYTWCRVQCVRTGYEITDVSEEHRRLLTIEQNLMIELTRLRSPERIERIARQKLGLVSPTPEQIIVVPLR